MLSMACGSDQPQNVEEIVTELGDNFTESPSYSDPQQVCTLENGTYLVCNDGSVEKISENTIGENGSSCSIEQIEGGALISCSDGTSVFVASETGGSDVQDGTNGDLGHHDYGHDFQRHSCVVKYHKNELKIVCKKGPKFYLHFLKYLLDRHNVKFVIVHKRCDTKVKGELVKEFKDGSVLVKRTNKKGRKVYKLIIPKRTHKEKECFTKK